MPSWGLPDEEGTAGEETGGLSRRPLREELIGGEKPRTVDRDLQLRTLGVGLRFVS
jgi:hypothetical protein